MQAPHLDEAVLDGGRELSRREIVEGVVAQVLEDDLVGAIDAAQPHQRHDVVRPRLAPQRLALLTLWIVRPSSCSKRLTASSYCPL
jgi:hypothetical protein